MHLFMRRMAHALIFYSRYVIYYFYKIYGVIDFIYPSYISLSFRISKLINTKLNIILREIFHRQHNKNQQVQSQHFPVNYCTILNPNFFSNFFMNFLMFSVHYGPQQLEITRTPRFPLFISMYVKHKFPSLDDTVIQQYFKQ